MKRITFVLASLVAITSAIAYLAHDIKIVKVRVGEISKELEHAARKLARRQIAREAMCRDRDSLRYPEEIANLRALQRQAEHYEKSSELYATKMLRDWYDAEWEQYYATNSVGTVITGP